MAKTEKGHGNGVNWITRKRV